MSAVARATTDTGAVGPLSNRLHAVLAVGMRLNPSVSTTGVVYSGEPPDPRPIVDDFTFMRYTDDGQILPPYSKNDPRWGGNFQWVMDRVEASPS